MINGYQPPTTENWQGRIDGTGPACQRWHQVMQLLDLNETITADLAGAFVLLGFACDEGVRRNQGRPGAAAGPGSIRTVLRNLPVHHTAQVMLYDAGNIICENDDLEMAQEQLAAAVNAILEKKGFPVVLGGGHEVAYGHFKGIRRSRRNNDITGIINFDAHFDLREPGVSGANSGTGFYQIANDLQEQGALFAYLPVGLQQISNTLQLFETAGALGVKYIEAAAMYDLNLPSLEQQVQAFLNHVDEVYLTIDLDVFAAAYAPGVSAVAFNGITPGYCFLSLLQQIFQSGKLVSFDIAELNPGFDKDQRTARLAAELIFRLVCTIDASQ
ncbi:formimidoylglutamase [Niabella beijingensis]|uniref:formimidoylglutamase n=1 Tax=Niabella beijingensis TaxID=2872700 RepID=UPI001CBD61E5|nr:formimidoylglutamase [Niabella beijingensis]MBZ4187749.1 formimidoylglutamase [Niabella beijingensis]